RAVIGGDVHATIGAGVEQPRLTRIGAHHADEILAGQAGGDVGPVRAVVGGAPGVRAEVGLAMVVHRDVGGAGLQRRDIDRADLAPHRQALGRDVLPALAAVAGELHQAVVGADPDLVVAARRGRDGEDHAVAAVARLLRRGLALAVLRAGLLAVQLGAYHAPVLALVGAAEQHLRAHVQRIRRLRRERDRGDPGVVVLEVGGALAVAVHRPRRDVLHH